MSECEYSDVQLKILNIKDELENYTIKSQFVKDIFLKKHIFVQDIKTLFYIKVDEILNSFSSIKDEENIKKICLVMIHMMIMILILKEKDYEKIDDIKDIESFNILVNERLYKLVDHVIEKNRKYGNSALKPIRIMSSLSTVEQLYIRLDDKLNRIINRQDDEDEDIPFDIAGYFILIYVYIELNKKE